MAKKNYTLEFSCTECRHPVTFTTFADFEFKKSLTCSSCQKAYQLSDELFDQLHKFEALCRQIQESKEIFGQAAIAVDVGPHHVKVPFQLLLTRLSSVLELNIGGETANVSFRVDTLKDLSLATSSK